MTSASILTSTSEVIFFKNSHSSVIFKAWTLKFGMVIGPTILNKIWPQIWPQLSPWPQPRKWHSEFLESLSNANWSWPNFYKPKFQVLAPSVENKCLLTRSLCTVQTVEVWWFYFSPIWNNISRSRSRNYENRDTGVSSPSGQFQERP